MEIVILNPSGVYGPTPSPTPSFENEVFEPVVKKRLPAIPPGGTGYAFVEGVPAGHLLAADKGRDGERYILADGYADFRELAETAKRIAGRGRIPPRMPVPVAKAVAVARRRALARHPAAAAAPRGQLDLHPLAGPPGLLEGSAGARVEDHPPRRGRPQDARTRWASCDAA